MRYGVKAAMGDAREMAALDVELLEIHLYPDDLPRRREALRDTFREVAAQWGHELVVHAPEFMPSPEGNRLVDLSHPDPAVRHMSVSTLESTVDLCAEVEGILVVAHPGGIVDPGDDAPPEGGIERLAASLAGLGTRAREAGVSLTVENMPWFYVHRPGGGRPTETWRSTILVGPEDFGPLSELVDGLTLDVSHAFLSRREGGMGGVEAFVEGWADRVLHLHLSDSLPPDHEGLQVGQGGVDFAYVIGAFRDRDVTAVPEIMGGHRRGGVSFKRALKELRRIASDL